MGGAGEHFVSWMSQGVKVIKINLHACMKFLSN